ncbi:MAG: carboxypeptidase M32 [Lachnospiraceae bacterium]|nr:carboxypeptidase M32 [Lachnospiraceae bacterium]
MNPYVNELNHYLEKASGFTSMMNLLDYDMQTCAPSGSDTNSSKLAGILADEYRNIFVDKRVAYLIKKCKSLYKKGMISNKEKAIIKEAQKKRNELLPISAKDYRDFKELTACSVNIWSKAKSNADFDSFAPTLSKIVDYKIKFAKNRIEMNKKNAGSSLYDIMLGDFEPDFNEKQLDAIFEKIKKEIIPLIKNRTKRDIPAWLKIEEHDKDKLRQFCLFLCEYLGFDPERGVIGESAHPFTINMHNHDVRITNNFDGESLIEPIFSAIHETGHALYELGIDNSITMTIIGEGTSMAMHEGQSRFFENMVGKQYSFWDPIYPKLIKLFPEKLDGIDLDDFLKNVNTVLPGPIRIQADELTYPLHIIVRYELERELIAGRLSVNDLPKAWNLKYKNYLDITPKNDAEGVLQDIHWATGEFGYFPSYLIGSAIAAQIYYHLKDVMPYDEYLKNGNIASVTNYLAENIYRYGKSLKTNILLKNMTGEEFNPDYYIKYLKEKYGN